ncbi:DUF3267 domain-containing protein [Tengunoibacter tsumagoiensis]|uniref:DUF3267 domain-containing protein n=1 Tax=Tengunoibacter tsumagoiensis TaxID=2014871 RepID=UPI0013871C86|nr:DUF3267 domain-containing protein [Tengunoibacter tsumagoiensis]
MSQIPEGYQLVSHVRLSQRGITYAIFLFVCFYLIWLELSYWSHTGTIIFQGFSATVIGLMMGVATLLLFAPVLVVHTLLQRRISSVLGYKVSYGLPAFFQSTPYFADPGQLQSRKDALLIALAPFGLSLLILFVSFFFPFIGLGSALLVVGIATAGGSLNSLPIAWKLLRVPDTTLLYIEGQATLSLLEPLDGQASSHLLLAEQKQKQLRNTFSGEASSASQWRPTYRKKDPVHGLISPEDVESVMQEFSRIQPTKLNVQITRWRANDVFDLASTIQQDMTSLTDTVLAKVDEEGKCLDLKFSPDATQAVTSQGAVEDEERDGKIVANAQWCEIKAIIGSGYLELTPTLIRVRLQRLPGRQTQIEIRGLTKKLWFGQRTAKKAAYTVAQWCELAS